MRIVSQKIVSKTLDDPDKQEPFAASINAKLQMTYLVVADGKLFKGKPDININDLDPHESIAETDMSITRFYEEISNTD